MATVTEIPTTATEVELPQEVIEEIPPLENGDRLTRSEFKRRYDAMPSLKKAELLEGIVHLMASPVSHKKHGRPHFQTITWLGQYAATTPGIEGGDNSSLELDPDNMPQPDCLLYVTPEFGGTVRFTEDDYVAGAPDLIVEIASSSASYDLHSKFNVYRRNGVKEYVVWQVRNTTIAWFVLRDSVYEPLAVNAEGIYQSTIFPGLWLDPTAMVAGDMAAVARTLTLGISTAEHAAFVASLAAKAASLTKPAV